MSEPRRFHSEHQMALPYTQKCTLAMLMFLSLHNKMDTEDRNLYNQRLGATQISHNLKTFDKKVLRIILESKREKTMKKRKLYNKELCNLHSSPSITHISVTLIKSRAIFWRYARKICFHILKEEINLESCTLMKG